MGNRPVAVPGGEPTADGAENLAYDAFVVVDVWQQREKQRKNDVPPISQNIHIEEAAKRCGEGQTTSFVIYSGHGKIVLKTANPPI